MKYYVFFCKNYIPLNSKSHDLVNIHFKNDPEFTIKTDLSVEYVLDFLNKHRHNPNIYVIFYTQMRQSYEIPILSFLSKFHPDTFKMKVIFFTFDFWRRADPPPNCVIPQTYSTVTRKIFQPKNHYTFTFAKNREQLSNLSWCSNSELEPYKDRIIFDTNVWSSYNSAFEDFNPDPETRVCVSGSINRNHYPERFQMELLSKTESMVIILPWIIDDQYGKKLNRYLCCFASPVHSVLGINTHLVLLKVFEILASGSLLLCPNTEEKYLNEIGLYHNKNCVLCDMKDISKVVNELVLLSNREKINQIRKRGYLFAKTHFTSEMKYKQIKRQIMLL